MQRLARKKRTIWRQIGRLHLQNNRVLRLNPEIRAAGTISVLVVIPQRWWLLCDIMPVWLQSVVEDAALLGVVRHTANAEHLVPMGAAGRSWLQDTQQKRFHKGPFAVVERADDQDIELRYQSFDILKEK